MNGRNKRSDGNTPVRPGALLIEAVLCCPDFPSLMGWAD